MSLAPLSSNLGVSRAKHLLRRACFHYNKELLYTISGLNVDQAIDYLLQDDTVSYEEPYDPLPSDSPHGYWLSSNEYPPNIPNQGRKRGLLSQWWFYNMVTWFGNESTRCHLIESLFRHICFFIFDFCDNNYCTRWW